MLLYYVAKAYFIIKTNIRSYYIQYIPSYIKSIKIIDTLTNTIKVYNKADIITPLKIPYTFYKINIWNQKEKEYKYYIVNYKLFTKFINTTNFINEIDAYHKIFKNNNIFAISINNEDVTNIFFKYKTSISIPNNIKVNVLYIYYCHKKKKKLYNDNEVDIIFTDYDFNETKYKLNEFIQ
jgi:hypothetical protein